MRNMTPVSSDLIMSPVNDVPSANENVSARAAMSNPQNQSPKTGKKILRTHLF